MVETRFIASPVAQTAANGKNNIKTCAILKRWSDVFIIGLQGFCVSRLEGPKGCEARSEANPVRWRPEAKRRGTPKSY